MRKNRNTKETKIGRLLLRSKLAQLGEIAVVFLVGLAVIIGSRSLVGDNPLAFHGVVWLGNVLMLLTVWLGLHLRGQNCGHFGLNFRRPNRQTFIRTVLLSFVVFVFAVAAFVMSAVVMANIVGMPEVADMTGYNYLHGNVPLLMLSLMGVYIVSSFGEEVIYRAFLINRIAELGSGTKWSWRVAVVISSLVFGLIHSEWAVAGMVQTGFMGVALGVSYLAVGRNLWVTILAHAYADTLLLVQLFFTKG
jgi:membrane protease YdiL (CAAX protease family)